MVSFFTALNPNSSNSGITFHATKYPYSQAMLQQNMPDMTLDLIIPFLWSQNLSIVNGVFETFTIFYGDHFDKKNRGFGQKGILDFSFLPLLSRKLIADTYLPARKNYNLLNFLAWAVALPIRAISFTLALALTIAMIPIILLIALFRALFSSPPLLLSPPPNGDNPPPPNGDNPPSLPQHQAMVLTLDTAYAALNVGVHHLELAGIRNQNNIRRLLQAPHHLALVYAMERLTYVLDENDLPLEAQEIFDFLFEHRDFWTDFRVIQNLDALEVVNQPIVRLHELQQEVIREPVEIQRQLNNSQSTHTASVHSSTSKSAARLKECYSTNDNSILLPNLSMARQVRNYDSNLVGQRTDEEILSSLNAAIDKLNRSTYIDAQSLVYSSDLLMYCWSAVHDKAQWREGVTEDTAVACFYAALYEIDREYALSESGVDNGRSGLQQACEGGSFNKLIEGLSKIHKLCEINFINPATAALKLPCVVIQELKKYLLQNPCALEKLKVDGLSEIWPELKNEVLAVIQSEFSTLYPQENGQVNPQLLALVEAGEYTDISQFVEQELEEIRRFYSQENEQVNFEEGEYTDTSQFVEQELVQNTTRGLSCSVWR